MERKIGEIFEYNGEWYQCIEQPLEFDDKGCNLCAMNKIKNCDIRKCGGQYRADGNSVIFKKLKKLGEPFTDNGKMYQRYEVFDIDRANARSGVSIYMPVSNEKFVCIVIKQNKEEMEENKLNMKPFDLELAKMGYPVCTRDGRKVRIICFNRLSGIREMPVVFLLKDIACDVEHIYTCTRKGCHYADESKSDLDLMLCPLKRIGYINIYDNNRVSRKIFETEEKAKIAANSTPDKYIKTIKIEWEE